MKATPWYCNAPYLVFFPLGAALAVAGVVPWLAFAVGGGAWRPVAHAVTEVQGALMSFAVGFLMTFVPRRTGTELPNRAELAVALTLVLPAPVLSQLGLDRAAQLAWMLLAVFIGAFVLRRIPRAVKQGVAVSELLWLPASFALALSGAAMLAAAGPGRPLWLPLVGAALLWQGLFAGLVAGIGGMLLPMLLHREPHRGLKSPRSWRLHAIAFLVFAASFALEAAVSMQLGYLLRGGVLLAVMVPTARLWRPPAVKGLHRWSAWLAAWLTPLGLLAVAASPAHRIALLHLTFLSGFMLLTLSVANHVIIAHGGRDPLLFAKPLRLGAMLALTAVATVARLLISIDPARLVTWIAVSAIAFLLAMVAWAAWVLPRLRPLPKAVDLPVTAATR